MTTLRERLRANADLRIEHWVDWWNSVSQQGVILELLVIIGCGLLAWVLASGARRAWSKPQEGASILSGEHAYDGALFPVLWLGFAYLARIELAHWQPVPLFRVALPALIALAMIRIGVKVLQAAFPGVKAVRALERSISWLAWLGYVLWILGLLPVVMQELDELTWQMGGTTLSVGMLVRGGITVGAVVMLALWLSAAIETRLLKAASGAELSVRIAVANAVRALLLFVGVLVAFSAVGINLTALSVLGGAIGVGIGLGLQKLAANYVSGFVVLAERAIRIGDKVKVDSFEGKVVSIRTRFTVIRADNGRESFVPNEMLVTQRVENLSRTETRLALSATVTVGYENDVEMVMSLLHQAAAASEGVLREPPPNVKLKNFGAEGLEFVVTYWIDQSQSDPARMGSDVNLAIWRALRSHDIAISQPQKVMHLVTDSSGLPTATPPAEQPGYNVWFRCIHPVCGRGWLARPNLKP